MIYRVDIVKIESKSLYSEKRTQIWFIKIDADEKDPYLKERIFFGFEYNNIETIYSKELEKDTYVWTQIIPFYTCSTTILDQIIDLSNSTPSFEITYKLYGFVPGDYFDGRRVTCKTIDWKEIKAGDVVLEKVRDHEYRTLTNVNGEYWDYLGEKDRYFHSTGPSYCHWLVRGQKGCSGGELVKIVYNRDKSYME